MEQLDRLELVRRMLEDEIFVVFGERLDFTLIVWLDDDNALFAGPVSHQDAIARLKPHGSAAGVLGTRVPRIG